MHPDCESCIKKMYFCNNYKFYELMYNHCPCRECIIKVNCLESCRERINLILWFHKLLKPSGEKYEI